MEQELKKLGLNGSEIKIYLGLLEGGISTPPKISRKTGIARPNVYHILNLLLDKGLVEKHRRGKRYSYVAKDPETTLKLLENKKEAIEKIIPDLKALHKQQTNKPVIHFYNGWGEVKSIYLKALEAEAIYFIGSLESFRKQDVVFYNRYQKRLRSGGVIVRDILSDGLSGTAAKTSKDALGKLYEQASLPDKFRNTPTDVVVWGNSVALISLEDPVFGTVLENKNLAETFKTIFNVMWSSLRSSK